MDEIARHHAHMANLQQLGEHWHRKLWDGSGPWKGDRYLNIYHHPLKDEIEVRYEVPNAAPQMVFQIPLADFDIDKLCRALAKADTMNGASHVDTAADVERHNAEIRTAEEMRDFERKEALVERMHWAINRDQGRTVAPLVIGS